MSSALLRPRSRRPLLATFVAMGWLVGCSPTTWEDIAFVDENSRRNTEVVQQVRDAVELFASWTPFDEVNLRTVAIVDADTFNEVDPEQPGRLDGAYIPHRHRSDISEQASVRLTTHHELCHAIDVTHGLAPRLRILRKPEVQDYIRAQRPFQARRPDREVFALLCDRGLRDAFSLTQDGLCGVSPVQQAQFDVQRAAFGSEPLTIHRETLFEPFVEIRPPPQVTVEPTILGPYRDGVLAWFGGSTTAPWLCDIETGQPERQVAAPSASYVPAIQTYREAIAYLNPTDGRRFVVTRDGVERPVSVLPQARDHVILDDLVLAPETPSSWVAQRQSGRRRGIAVAGTARATSSSVLQHSRPAVVARGSALHHPHRQWVAVLLMDHRRTCAENCSRAMSWPQ